jgi:hypothetical protein
MVEIVCVAVDAEKPSYRIVVAIRAAPVMAACWISSFTRAC